MKTAYPQTQNAVSIRLYSNIPFDNTYQHHSLISTAFKYNIVQLYTSTEVAKERFIDRKDYSKTGYPYYYPRYDLTGTFNFNFSNGLLGNVTLELTPAQTNANYMRVTCGTDVYYYFITGIIQVNFETYTLQLELDVLMTYQDEFLAGMKDIPVFTERKFCVRYNNKSIQQVKCADYKSGDTAFSSAKPNIIKYKKTSNYKNTLLSMNGKGKQIMWCYVCSDLLHSHTDTSITYPYCFDGKPHPLSMICFPLNLPDDIDYLAYYKGSISNDNLIRGFDASSIRNIVTQLVSAGTIHGCKISPYPPYDSTTITYSTATIDSVRTLRIVIPSSEFDEDNNWNNLRTKLKFSYREGETHRLFMVILNELQHKFNLTGITLDGLIASGTLGVKQNRRQDPKLLFSPFRKYKLTSCYSTGVEVYPELAYSDGSLNSDVIFLDTYTTCYIGDTSISTYIQPIVMGTAPNDIHYFDNYLEDSLGLVSNINYNIPVGTNALDVFNSTQAQAFYQSKTASGITAGLTIAGGLGSTALGIAGAVGSLGISTPVSAGLIATGVSATASGIASLTNTIKSTEAKIEDLNNTPDSFNVIGGSFVSDYQKLKDVFPYLLIYECNEVTKHKADDFFYNYGYEVARECYFNTELLYSNYSPNFVDNNIFCRNIFNYVKLNEDITNKINSDIPIIAKKKLSAIFNNGITLWSFFKTRQLWDTAIYETSDNWLDRWFMKCELDNTENIFVL